MIEGRVVVAVVTYRRPGDLAELLPMLVEQAAGVPGAELLVVDNDPAGSAAAVVSAVDAAVRYVHEPTPGIAAARNRALAEARADVLVFVDDDERPVDGWLASLLRTYAQDRPAGVVGPVVSRFTGELDPWIADGGFFRRRNPASGTEVDVAATNNLLLDLHQVRAAGLRFDERLGLVGGEDTLFTRQLVQAGGRLVWCAEALVHDIVPADRMTRRWVLRRAFRMGGSASSVAVTLSSPGARRATARARQVVLGGSRLASGALRTLAGTALRSPRLRANGARNLARGLGLVAGAVGYVHAEYRRGS